MPQNKRIILWDPLAVQPTWRRPLWLILSLYILATGSNLLIRSIDPVRPDERNLFDFVQEWTSARNLLAGLPVYTNQQESLPGHRDGIGFHPKIILLNYNAHPPVSVLLGVPLALFSYRTAHLAWNLISLGLLGISLSLIIQSLRIEISPLGILVLSALLSLLNPLQQQLIHGQLNLVLLLLLTLSWRADRTVRPVLAGAALGIAVTIKVFPAFLLLYFLFRRDWIALLSAVTTAALLTLLSLPLLGLRTYQDYVTQVLPQVSVFRSHLINASLPAYWIKLFEGATLLNTEQRLQAVFHAPILAKVATAVSIGMILGQLYLVTSRAKNRDERDYAFGLAITAMLLLSPICWEHYFLLLSIPFVLGWRDLPENFWVRCLFLGFLVLNMLNYPDLRETPKTELHPGLIATRLSIFNYILMLFWIFQLLIGWFVYPGLVRWNLRRPGSVPTTPLQ